jgi:hypothetical protein
MGRTSTINLFTIIASARRRVVVPHVSKQHLAGRGNNVKNCSCVHLMFVTILDVSLIGQPIEDDQEKEKIVKRGGGR